MGTHGRDSTLDVLLDEIAGYLDADDVSGDVASHPISPFDRGRRIRFDDVARAVTATPPIAGRRRVWIGAGGVVVCDLHAEALLRTAIERCPRALWHHTERGHWVASHLPEFRCETCTDLLAHPRRAPRRPTDEGEQ